MSTTYEVELPVTVRVTINDESVIDQALSEDWQKDFYDFRDRNEVIANLAYNCAANWVENLGSLDGFANLAKDAATMKIHLVFEEDAEVREI